MPHTTPVLATSLEARGATEGDVLEIDDVSRTFKDGRKRLTAVHDVSLSLQARRDLRPRGRVGQRQDHAGQVRHRPASPPTPARSTFEGKQLRPTAGRRSQDALRAIQMVFQNPDSTLNPAWSTRAILTRAVRKLGGAREGTVRAKVDKLSADVRVEPRFLLQRPTDLSGGQKQRIAIARAFAGDPTLVICDEPASALDVSVQASILNLLVELQTNEQVSYVFISHDLAVVRYISDRIGVMYLAELIEVGSAEEVFNPPHHPYTEALLSSIPKLDFDSRAAAHRAARHACRASASRRRAAASTRAATASSGDICETQEPPVQEAGDGHTYKCHIPPDELLALQTADGARSPHRGVAPHGHFSSSLSVTHSLALILSISREVAPATSGR